MKTKLLTTFTVAGLMATSLAMPTWADKLPTDPIGGKPAADTTLQFLFPK
jgi:hypothetical protein